MKKLLALAALVLSSSPAHAGVGSTAFLGATSDGTAWAPSLDIRSEGWLVQIHALDLIGMLPSKYINVGLDVSKIAVKRKVGEEVEGVFMPGASVRFLADTGFASKNFNVLAEARLGAEMKQGMGFGLYVVPQIGVGNLASVGNPGGDFGLVYGGSLQASVWFKK